MVGVMFKGQGDKPDNKCDLLDGTQMLGTACALLTLCDKQQIKTFNSPAGDQSFVCLPEAEAKTETPKPVNPDL